MVQVYTTAILKPCMSCCIIIQNDFILVVSAGKDAVLSRHHRVCCA